LTSHKLLSNPTPHLSLDRTPVSIKEHKFYKSASGGRELRLRFSGQRIPSNTAKMNYPEADGGIAPARLNSKISFSMQTSGYSLE